MLPPNAWLNVDVESILTSPIIPNAIGLVNVDAFVNTNPCNDPSLFVPTPVTNAASFMNVTFD